MNTNTGGLKKFSLFHILIIATLAIVIYSNTLNNGFVYDDEFTIVNNTLVKSFDNLPLLFDKTAYFSRSVEMSYRPVVTFTYFLDYTIYGLKPWGYHLTNILLHAINGALLYTFLTLLFTPHASRPTSLPFLTSLLFVTHPVLTEAVTCISFREDLLAFMFYMATLNLHLILKQPAPDPRFLTTSFLFLLSYFTYLLALLSKEMAVTLPLIVICYEWFSGKEKTTLGSRLFNRYTISYIIITLLYLYLRFYIFHNPKEQIETWGLVERFLTLPWLIMNYLKLSLFPVQLSVDYVIAPVSSPFSPIFILPVSVLVSVFAIILSYFLSDKGGYKKFPPFAKGGEGGFESGYLRQRSILFGALFFLITLAPVYNLVPINPFAERYLYLPIVGFIMFAVCIEYLIAEKLKIRPGYVNRYMLVFFLVISTIFSFSVVKRNLIWKDNYSLWSDTVAKMPNSNRSHTNLGLAYYNRGRVNEAIGEYLIAIKLRFDDARAHYNLAVAYLKQGRYDEEIYELKTALRLKPDYVKASNNLGVAYARQGLFDQAVKELLVAVRLAPDDMSAHYNLGRTYSEQGRYDEAIDQFKIILTVKPDDKETYHKLKVLMEKKKGYKGAGSRIWPK